MAKCYISRPRSDVTNDIKIWCKNEQTIEAIREVLFRTTKPLSVSRIMRREKLWRIDVRPFRRDKAGIDETYRFVKEKLKQYADFREV